MTTPRLPRFGIEAGKARIDRTTPGEVTGRLFQAWTLAQTGEATLAGLKSGGRRHPCGASSGGGVGPSDTSIARALAADRLRGADRASNADVALRGNAAILHAVASVPLSATQGAAGAALRRRVGARAAVGVLAAA